MNFAYQGKHAPAKLASMVASSMVATANSASANTSSWLIDTGCSDHVTPDLSQLSSTSQATASHETAIVGNGQELPMTHIGNAKLQIPFHCFRLDNILKVPDLASNLLFVHKLCLQNNAFCYFDANQFLIVDLATGKVLYQGLSKDGVYPIPFPSQLSVNSAIASSLAFKSSVTTLVSNEAMLWHQRLGHPCSKLLHSTLSSFNNSFKISIHDDICSQCKSCISAKMHKLSFPQHVMSSTSPLQLVHSDVWGPAPVTSTLGYKYYVIFVDDFTRFT